jgi:RNA polymerase sigma-70 factor (sigma-E family)
MSTEPGFEPFVAAAWPGLVRAAWLLSGDRRYAEDIAQATLVRAWRHWGRVSAADDPLAYVRGILANEFLRLRVRWRRDDELYDVHADRRTDVESDVATRDLLARALRRVPRRQRLVLVLRFYFDMSETATAAALGCSVGTVKSQASRGLDRLRRELEPHTMVVEGSRDGRV